MAFYLNTYIKWEDILTYCRDLSLPEKPDLILAVHRGGLPLGVILSHKYNIPMEVIYFSRYDNSTKVKCKLPVGKKYNKILLVDDISDEGESLIRIKKYLKKKYSIKELTTLTYAIKNKTQFKPTYFKKEYDDHIWLIFPWEAI